MKALKAEIDKQDNDDPQKSVKDWQNIVKKYEAGLEAVFDQTMVDKWKAKKDGQEAFNNTASLESLIKKVVIMKKDANGQEVFDKVEQKFIEFITKKAAKLKTLSDLFAQREPKEVITLIHQWEYSKLGEAEKKERHKKFA
jgi:hypothetical protein